MKKEEVEQRLSEEEARLNEELERIGQEIDSIQRTLAELKVKLYGKFKTSINLEEE